MKFYILFDTLQQIFARCVCSNHRNFRFLELLVLFFLALARQISRLELSPFKVKHKREADQYDVSIHFVMHSYHNIIAWILWIALTHWDWRKKIILTPSNEVYWFIDLISIGKNKKSLVKQEKVPYSVNQNRHCILWIHWKDIGLEKFTGHISKMMLRVNQHFYIPYV